MRCIESGITKEKRQLHWFGLSLLFGCLLSILLPSVFAQDAYNPQAISQLKYNLIYTGTSNNTPINQQLSETYDFSVLSKGNSKVTATIKSNDSSFNIQADFFVTNNTRDIYFTTNTSYFVTGTETELYLGNQISNQVIITAVHELSNIERPTETQLSFINQKTATFNGATITLNDFQGNDSLSCPS